MLESSRIRGLRKAVLERALGCCKYCRNPAKYAGAFSLDHVEPRSKGCKTTLENLAFACISCNGHTCKRTQANDPITGQSVPLFNPRKQRWRDHFGWSDDCTIIQGLSPIGRATVYALQLNREDAVNLRKPLFDCGEHPPDD